MTFIWIIIVIAIMLAIDKLLIRRKLTKLNEDPQLEEKLLDEHNELSKGRFVYLATFIVLVIVIGTITNLEMGFTTEPDYESIKLINQDYRIQPTGDLTKLFVVRAENDTNGWLWGGSLLLTGLLGLRFKISIIGAKIGINPFGDIQYMINTLSIILGLILIFRVTIYNFFQIPFDVDYSYWDYIQSFGLSD